MPVINILKNFALFIDGRGYAGQIEEVNPPKLMIKTEEHRAGGMDAPAEIDMGMEKLECDFSTSNIDSDLLKSWGVAPGNLVPMTFRGALESEDGAVVPVTMEVRGTVKEIDWGTWKAGEKSPFKASMAVRYYKLDHDGTTLHEIDVDNMTRVIDGVDRLEEQRSALGLSGGGGAGSTFGI